MRNLLTVLYEFIKNVLTIALSILLLLLYDWWIPAFSKRIFKKLKTKINYFEQV